jgi:hypothetical protein
MPTMTPDLDALQRLAEAASKRTYTERYMGSDWQVTSNLSVSHDGYWEAVAPENILALIARLRAAEAVVEAARKIADEKDEYEPTGFYGASEAQAANRVREDHRGTLYDSLSAYDAATKGTPP